MCTLVLWSPGDGTYVVAANRDEFLARPAREPYLWPGETFVAPQDVEAGGTWLGLNAHGVFVGITNRATRNLDAGRLSRGGLVVDALRSESAAALHQALATVEPGTYNPFHLLYTDGWDTFVTWSDGDLVCQDRLGTGLIVVTERSLGGDDQGRTEWLEHQPLPADVTGWRDLLSYHRPDKPFAGTCVHAPEFGYGTRSCLVLVKPLDLADSQWVWSEGPTCTATPTDRPDLVAQLADIAASGGTERGVS